VSRPRVLLTLAALFAALAGLDAAGSFTGIDQWAIDHVMPGARFGTVHTNLLADVIPLYHVRWSRPWSVAVNVVTLPASFLVSLAIVWLVSRRLGIALVAAVAVEVLCKETIDRPALHKGTLHIVSFDSSFPSGHALRALLVGFAVASIRPWLRGIAAAWVVASLALLLLAGWHTPSDLLGGAALGLLGAGGAGALRRGRLARA
jgi:membrane-associated phospholipid phosphatase